MLWFRIDHTSPDMKIWQICYSSYSELRVGTQKMRLSLTFNKMSYFRSTRSIPILWMPVFSFADETFGIKKKTIQYAGGGIAAVVVVVVMMIAVACFAKRVNLVNDHCVSEASDSPFVLPICASVYVHTHPDPVLIFPSLFIHSFSFYFQLVFFLPFFFFFRLSLRVFL